VSDISMCMCAVQQVKTLTLGWCKVGAGEGAAGLADLLLFDLRLTSRDVLFSFSLFAQALKL
jgi:hypothetical protein